ncbi:MAG: NAD(P)-dependent alcohol dehydrogenase [Gemmatimonadota bacterium]
MQSRYGSPQDLEVREVERPGCGPDEVLVRVHAASLHPDVWHVVTGRPYVIRLMGNGFSRPRNPIPGTDMAGVVDSVGADVTSFRPGDAVFGETMPSHQWTNGGSLAELVTVRPEWIARKPPNVSFEQAASVPTSGYIALLNLRGGRVVGPDARVLVNGAGGGVGSLALQIAKSRGAHVTAVDAAGKLDLLRSLGADRVMDYASEDFTLGDARYDLIFDVPGNHPISACRRVLKTEGKYVLIGHEAFGGSGNRLVGLFPRFIGLILRSLFTKQLRLGGGAPTRQECMATLSDLLEAGAITPVIDSTFPLAGVHEAFRHLIEDDLRGKVIVRIAEAA